MIRPLTVDLEGQKVKVYRNLRNGLFSIQVNGLVVAHVESVNLRQVVFTVSAAGRARVLRDKQKNVHAYAVGTYTATRTSGEQAVTYCPYTAPHFYEKATAAPVYTAAAARIEAGAVFI